MTPDRPHTSTGGKKVQQKAVPDKEIIEEKKDEPTPRQFAAPSGHEVRK